MLNLKVLLVERPCLTGFRSLASASVHPMLISFHHLLGAKLFDTTLYLSVRLLMHLAAFLRVIFSIQFSLLACWHQRNDYSLLLSGCSWVWIQDLSVLRQPCYRLHHGNDVINLNCLINYSPIAFANFFIYILVSNLYDKTMTKIVA